MAYPVLSYFWWQRCIFFGKFLPSRYNTCASSGKASCTLDFGWSNLHLPIQWFTCKYTHGPSWTAECHPQDFVSTAKEKVMFPLWNLKSQELYSPGTGWEISQLSSRQSLLGNQLTTKVTQDKQERALMMSLDTGTQLCWHQANSSFQVYKPTRSFSFIRKGILVLLGSVSNNWKLYYIQPLYSYKNDHVSVVGNSAPC